MTVAAARDEFMAVAAGLPAATAHVAALDFDGMVAKYRGSTEFKKLAPEAVAVAKEYLAALAKMRSVQGGTESERKAARSKVREAERKVNAMRKKIDSGFAAYK